MIQPEKLDSLVSYLETLLPENLELLEEMVSINSFTANAAGVDVLGQLTAKSFAPLGFLAELVPSKNPLHGDHLVLSRLSPKGSGAPTIGLVSHLDTVFPSDEERRNNFAWRIEGDKAFGPGTVDIKGGTIVMRMTLASLGELLPETLDKANWIILLNAAEETLEPEFGQLCRERLPADALACLVFEGGRKRGNHFAIVSARKGMATYRLTANGRAAHAGGSHRRGANAIIQLAHTLTRISELTDYENDLTYNVGTVAGGTVLNRVPHHAVASGEMRAFRPEVLDDGVDRLLALANRVDIQSINGNYPCSLTIDILNRWAPWPPNGATDRLLTIWQEAAASLGMEVIREERGGLSDGNFLWDYVPTLDGLGPSGGNAHCSERSEGGSKEQEYVRISSFVPKTLLNVVAISQLLEQGRKREAPQI